VSRSKVERPLAKLRAGEYPTIGDQLDALWKGYQALLEGDIPPPETVVMLERVKRVKARFPKKPKP